MKSSPVFSATVLGKTWKFITGPGVFSRGELDEGSRILLEHLQLGHEARVCDLGCGWGAIGMGVALRWPGSHVYSVDINARACQLAGFNYELNEITNASVWCADGLKSARPNAFTDVVCNPPIRAGNAVIASLFVDALTTLEEGGRLWVVIRTSQGAKSWQKRLQQLFGSCETVAIHHGYRVFRAVATHSRGSAG